MSRIPRPSVSDTIGITEFIRSRGSVDYPLEAVPGDFVLWRRKIRRKAKQFDMRVSVVRSGDIVLVPNSDHEPSRDELQATVAVIGSLASDLLGVGYRRGWPGRKSDGSLRAIRSLRQPMTHLRPNVS